MESKYQKVENYFIKRINAGTLKVGEQLPPEVEMTKFFGYSRMTINKAINNLTKMGYVTRISGRGTFVKTKNITKLINENIGLTDEIRNQGMTPSSKLIKYELINVSPSSDIGRNLNTPDEILVHHFIRLHYGDSKPVALNDEYIISSTAKNFDINLLNDSLYSYLNRLKLPVIQNSLEISAVSATKEQQSLLNLPISFLLKTSANVDTVDNNGDRKKLGLLISYYNPRMYTYKFINKEQ